MRVILDPYVANIPQSNSNMSNVIQFLNFEKCEKHRILERKCCPLELIGLRLSDRRNGLAVLYWMCWTHASALSVRADLFWIQFFFAVEWSVIW